MEGLGSWYGWSGWGLAGGWLAGWRVEEGWWMEGWMEGGLEWVEGWFSEPNRTARRTALNHANRNRVKTHPRNRNEPKRNAALLFFKTPQTLNPKP